MKQFLKMIVLIAGLVPVLGISLAYAEITKQQAASIAQSQFAGRVIAIKAETHNGAQVYNVRVLDKSGGLHIVVINSQDGKIISSSNNSLLSVK